MNSSTIYKYMSRVGKKPIVIPDGVQVEIKDDLITVKGAKGELKQIVHPAVSVEQKERELLVAVKNTEDKREKSLWGLFNRLITNMILGVTKGFEKKLEINGIGYKAALAGSKLVLNVGYSHPIDFPLPPGIAVSVEKNIITVQGIDKQLVGETAACIRSTRKPEPYKGKGIRYVGEVVRHKAGKAAKTGAGTE